MPVRCAPWRAGPPASAPALGALLLLRLAGVASGGDPVVALGDEDFNETVERTERMLVEFHSPSCGHCKQFAPEYRKAAKELRKLGLLTMLAKVDVAEEADLRSQFQVDYFPTFVYVVRGEEAERFTLHEGNATAASVAAWVKTRELSAISAIPDEKIGQTLEKIRNGSFALVARVRKQSKPAQAFWQGVKEHLADWDHDVAILRSIVMWLPADADGGSDADAAPATLHLYRPGFAAPDPVFLEYEGEWDALAIARWARRGTYPAFGSTCDARRHRPQVLEEFGFDGCVAVVLDHAIAVDLLDTPAALTREEVLKALGPVAAAEPRWYFTACLAGSLGKDDEKMLGGKRASAPFISVMHGATKKKYVSIGAEEVLKPDKVRAILQKLSADGEEARLGVQGEL